GTEGERPRMPVSGHLPVDGELRLDRAVGRGAHEILGGEAEDRPGGAAGERRRCDPGHWWQSPEAENAAAHRAVARLVWARRSRPARRRGTARPGDQEAGGGRTDAGDTEARDELTACRALEAQPVDETLVGVRHRRVS